MKQLADPNLVRKWHALLHILYQQDGNRHTKECCMRQKEQGYAACALSKEHCMTKRAEAFKGAGASHCDHPTGATATVLGIGNSNTHHFRGVESHPDTRGFGLLPDTAWSHQRAAAGATEAQHLTPWETWCPPPPRIIALGWSVRVMTKVEYIIRTPQGNVKHELRLESCSEP